MQTVLGIFTKKDQAEAAIRKLGNEGFNEEKSSLVTDTTSQNRVGHKGGSVHSESKIGEAILLAVPVLSSKESRHVKSIFKQHDATQIEVIQL